MTVDLILVGKTDSAAVGALVEDYLRRINHYVKFSLITVPDKPSSGRGIARAAQMQQQCEAILRQITPGDYVALLDERGMMQTSEKFAEWMQKRMNSGLKRLVFVIGGAYGFSEELRARADAALSLSPMTFSHQIVRAIFAEQLYRSLTILAGEPYHHS